MDEFIDKLACEMASSHEEAEMLRNVFSSSPEIICKLMAQREGRKTIVVALSVISLCMFLFGIGYVGLSFLFLIFLYVYFSLRNSRLTVKLLIFRTLREWDELSSQKGEELLNGIVEEFRSKHRS